MIVHTYLSTVESKKQEEQRQNDGYGEGFDGCQMEGGGGGMGIKVMGLRSTNR